MNIPKRKLAESMFEQYCSKLTCLLCSALKGHSEKPFIQSLFFSLGEEKQRFNHDMDLEFNLMLILKEYNFIY